MSDPSLPENTPALAPAADRRASFAARYPVVFLAGFAAALALGAFAIWQITTGAERAAEAACLATVSANLKAPATAEYNVTDVIDRGAGEYWIDGTVDAQNEFGALVRSDFRCVVQAGTVEDLDLISR